ncbi:metallophosphoesterase [Eubacteriales bacterium OttesenSCG-928-N13]|nr:metallophosphoesterase [Eubacteriales bacterium OttesenSCG-928-N13]
MIQAMAIFSIADLHLDSGGKPMDVFGEQWKDHAERIFLCWREMVTDQDIVLLPGDLSWAMRLEDAVPHLEWIGSMPGTKLILRGNHDYWWSSLSRVRDMLPARMFAIQNDSMMIDGTLFAGTRGWLLPGEEQTPADEKVYLRELMRLSLSLKSARARSEDAPLVVMMHYPPLTKDRLQTGFTEILQAHRADHVVYGHLHGASLKGAFRGCSEGIEYHQVSADGLDFQLKRIL